MELAGVEECGFASIFVTNGGDTARGGAAAAGAAAAGGFDAGLASANCLLLLQLLLHSMFTSIMRGYA